MLQIATGKLFTAAVGAREYSILPANEAPGHGRHNNNNNGRVTMQRVLAAAAVALGSILTCNSALADALWKNYKDWSRGGAPEVPQILDNYIAGASSAFLSANAALAHSGQPQLYCQPRDLPLNVGNIKAMLDSAVTKNPSQFSDDMPLSMTVLFLLKDTFPCQPGRQ
ncbi:hypothetical protein [Cupriavidus sp. D39]|uniref:hypothetical protein n=1 Tax=Cupriavidus sp. D39 TaxID=2997877 RepID=UPI0022709CED|nr:hypothetical protein [Cupriavidus sp. D39]MCY0854074.1 hypothetical protein [Cupriavidus sp. D39]